NVILTAVGYNLRLVLAWLRILLRLFLIALCRSLAIPPTIKSGLLTADYLIPVPSRVKKDAISGANRPITIATVVQSMCIPAVWTKTIAQFLCCFRSTN
ncbi:MAG TPA: hypothetical protein VGZ89_10175, partial [Xanthobacteraceae bacterium]|nr:hypothetical protein [Xanthobacteraceae bacterium]